MTAPAPAFLAIVNPAAGNGAGKRLAPVLAERFRGAGLRIEVLVTPGPGEAARLASEAADDGYDVVVAVGGDGTANEVANGLIGTSTALALYPIGAGNDLARGLGYPRRAQDFAAFLAVARPRRIDVGEVNGRIFVNAAGVGIDGVVAEGVQGSTRIVGPTLGYLAGALGAIATYRPVRMRATIDGVASDARQLVIVASNGPFFGNGMRPAPRADFADGWLDLTVADGIGRLATLGALVRLYRGTHANGTTIRALRARTVSIELDHPMLVEIDGEILRAASIAIGIRPLALTVLAA
ncbi:MAG TPA: diacylglycerol kinase family protein [Candidatus Limnocylindria bacterium]